MHREMEVLLKVPRILHCLDVLKVSDCFRLLFQSFGMSSEARPADVRFRVDFERRSSYCFTAIEFSHFKNR